MKSIFLLRNSLFLILAATHNTSKFQTNPLAVAAAASTQFPTLSSKRTRIGTPHTFKLSHLNNFSETASRSLSRSSSESSLPLFDIRGGASENNMSSQETSSVKSGGLPDSVKLLIGAGGIYGAFLYYGSLQEDVFRYTALDGAQFKEAWFLQVLEALANVVVGSLGLMVTGATSGIPKKMFAISGATQVSAKAMTSLALANGLSFPVATLGECCYFGMLFFFGGDWFM